MTNYNYYFNIIEDITALEDKLSVKKDFNLEGKVQAVGLRKKVHAIDLPDNTRALAVNNPYTGKVELSVRSRSKDKLEIAVEKIDKALKKVDIEKRRPIEFKYIKLSKTAIRKLRYKHNIHYLRSASYKDGEKVELPTIREFMNKLKARYQLKEVEGSLRGYIPVRAIRQLKGKEVMYEDLAPDNRIRTINKAKTIQREGLAKTASIILDIKVGDILLGGRFKNVKTKVKKIGKDENNQPTINGKKLLSFRIDKLMPKKKDKKASTYRISDKIAISQGLYNRALQSRIAKIIAGYGSNPSRVVSKSNVIGNMKKAVTSYRDKALTKSLTGGAFGSGGNYPSAFRNANIRNTAVNSIDSLAQNAINKTPWQLLPRIA